MHADKLAAGTDKSDGSARRTQVQRRAEAERRVLESAMTLIAQSGSRAITLAQVGEAAGYSRGIVHQYFGNRAGLLDAVMRDAGTFDVPDYDGNALDQIAELVASYFRNVVDRTPSSRAFLQLWGEAIANDPVLTPLFAERDASFRSFLAGQIRAGVKDGSVRADIDPKSAAVLLLSILRGTGLQLIASPPVGRLSALVAEAKRSVSAALTA